MEPEDLDTSQSTEQDSIPTVDIISRSVPTAEGNNTIYLSIVTYSNAIQAALYDNAPKLGSMSLAYPVMKKVERQTIFKGKDDQLAHALALILANTTKKIVYASVNIKEHTVVTNELIREMIAEFKTTST